MLIFIRSKSLKNYSINRNLRNIKAQLFWKATTVKDEKFILPLTTRKLALFSPTSNSLEEISWYAWLWVVKVRTE